MQIKDETIYNGVQWVASLHQEDGDLTKVGNPYCQPTENNNPRNNRIPDRPCEALSSVNQKIWGSDF